MDRSASPGKRLAPALLATAALLAACRDAAAPAPLWEELAPRMVRRPPAEPRTSFRWNGRDVAFTAASERLTLRIPLAAGDWVPLRSGSWHVPLGLQVTRRQKGAETALLLGGDPVPEASLAGFVEERALAGYTVRKGTLLYGDPAGDPPGDGRLEVRLELPAEEGLRVVSGDFTARGVTVHSGWSASVELPPCSGRRLSFGTVVEPLLGTGECVFRARLAGEVLLEHRATSAESPVFAWHGVDLPDSDEPRLLELEVDGSLAYTAFLDPVLGPAERGARGRRPWGAARPDVVIFLADTFRADNMAAYGGTAGVTPALDAFARKSLLFTHAWSTSTWTLPAHATLFSGYYPRQVGVNGQDRRLPESVLTLAEMFAANGYRTGAVTDGGIVSSRFGLDQGFGFFSERGRPIEQMLREAKDFLDADDGRPAFLFMHTYRVHWPYRAAPETRAERGIAPGSPMDLLDAILAEANATHERAFEGIPDLADMQASGEMRDLAERMRALYLGGVAELDAAVGGFLADLERERYLDSGYLLFTSDHGEAFVEHGAFFHGFDAFDELARVPLFLAGPGIAAGRRDEPVSLIDVPPTLADLAAVPRPSSWPGRSLLAEPGERALFGFELRDEPADTLFVLRDARKLFCVTEEALRGGPTPRWTYDLATDPQERDDLGPDEPWAHELLRLHEDELLEALEPIVQGENAEIDPEKAAELRALGY